MKKIIVKVLAVCFLCGMFFMTGREKVEANAVETIRSGDYEYQILNSENKYAALRKVYNYGAEVTIPDTIDGYSIIQIGAREAPIGNTGDNMIGIDFTKATIFSEKDNIVKKLVIPEGVTEITKFAFNEMNCLEELSLPKTLHKIWPHNFKNSTLLKKIEFPAEISVGDKCFENAVFDEMILNGNFSGYDDDNFGYMKGRAEKVTINADNTVVVFGNTPINKFVIGKKVKNIKLGPCSCKNIVLNNPKTKLKFFSADECNVNKISAAITKNIKCKKSSDGYTYSWKPVKIKGKKSTVRYALSYKNSNGEFRKFKVQKKTSIKLSKRRKLRIEVEVQFDSL